MLCTSQTECDAKYYTYSYDVQKVNEVLTFFCFFVVHLRIEQIIALKARIDLVQRSITFLLLLYDKKVKGYLIPSS